MAKSEGRKLGDSFYRDTFKKGIRSKTNLILKISIILVFIELIDEIPIIMDVLQEDPALKLFSVVEILVPVVLVIIIFVLVKELNKWEETYKKVKNLID